MGARKQQRKEERQRRAAEGDDRALREKRSFHRGEVVNFHPRAEDFARDEFLEDYLLKGWVPPKPVLSRGMRITAFGSCFAANITRHLSAIGFDLSRDRDPEVYISRLGDAMVNTASMGAREREAERGALARLQGRRLRLRRGHPPAHARRVP
jgi:hypothetical protein